MTTVEFFADPSLTLTAQLFQVDSDAVVDTASAVTEEASVKGAYLADFAPVSVGAYLIVAYDSGVAISAAYVYCDASGSIKRSGNYADVVCAMQADVMRSITQNKTVTNPVSGVMTVYADDDTTPLLEAQLYENAAETQTYRGHGAEVRGRLA